MTHRVPSLALIQKGETPADVTCTSKSAEKSAAGAIKAALAGPATPAAAPAAKPAQPPPAAPVRFPAVTASHAKSSGYLQRLMC